MSSYMNITKIPPYSHDAEQSVLGSILMDGDSIEKALEIIKSNDFYEPVHKTIFECILNLYNKKIPIDVVTLQNELANKGVLDDIGGIEYLSKLALSVPTSVNIEQYAKIVKEKSIRRQAIKLSFKIADIGYNTTQTDPVIIASDIQELTNKINVDDTSKGMDMEELADNFLENLEKRRSLTDEELSEYHVDLADWNKFLDGVHKGELTILAARPGVGKTALSTQFGLFLAKKGMHVLLNCMEMSREQMFARLACFTANINGNKLRSPKKLTENDLKTLKQHVNEIKKLNIDIQNIPCIEEFHLYCSRKKKNRELDLVVVDYIQLMNTSQQVNTRDREIGIVSGTLKNAISLKMDIPVLALAQLSRLVERGNRKPILSDLRESGNIEQDADNVVFLHNPNEEDDDEENTNRQIKVKEIIIGKQRNGVSNISFEVMNKPSVFKFFNAEYNRRYAEILGVCDENG